MKNGLYEAHKSQMLEDENIMEAFDKMVKSQTVKVTQFSMKKNKLEFKKFQEEMLDD